MLTDQNMVVVLTTVIANVGPGNIFYKPKAVRNISISHPLSPAPAGCNVKDVPNKQKKGMEEVNKGEETSNLHKQTNANMINQAQ